MSQVTNTLGNGEAMKSNKRRIAIQFDIEYTPHPGTENNQDSETVPDLNISVRQLLENHTRGHGNETVQVRQPLYFETEIPNIKDITDVERYKDTLKERLEDVEDFIHTEKAQKEQQERQNNGGTDNPETPKQPETIEP